MNRTLYRTFTALALLGVVLTQSARAEQAGATLIDPQAVFFLGSSSTTILPFNTTSAGKVTFDINDFEWPVALQSLSFSAASGTNVLVSAQANSQKSFSISFDVGGPGAFFAQISALAGASAFPGLPRIGAYSLDATFMPQVTGVPLPPAVWLFATGLLGVLGADKVLRRRGLSLPLAPTPV
jgi:hypothetical protein